MRNPSLHGLSRGAACWTRWRCATTRSVRARPGTVSRSAGASAVAEEKRRQRPTATNRPRASGGFVVKQGFGGSSLGERLASSALGSVKIGKTYGKVPKQVDEIYAAVGLTPEEVNEIRYSGETARYVDGIGLWGGCVLGEYVAAVKFSFQCMSLWICSFDWLIWLMDRFVELFDRSIDWLIDWLICRLKLYFHQFILLGM